MRPDPDTPAIPCESHETRINRATTLSQIRVVRKITDFLTRSEPEA